MNVKKYEVLKDVVIIQNLYLKGDVLYIQNYDPINGKAQMVFSNDRKLIGVISSDFYWKLEKDECIKYFTEQPSENVELEEFDLFGRWVEASHFEFCYTVNAWRNVNGKVPFSEVLQAFKNRNK